MRLIMSVLVLSLAFLSINAAFASNGHIDAGEALKKVEAGALLLDVRSADEFKAGHVSGALNIPHDQIEGRLSEIAAYKDKDVVVYCRSGRRAGLAMETLGKSGFKSAFNAGGLSDLEKAGARVVE